MNRLCAVLALLALSRAPAAAGVPAPAGRPRLQEAGSLREFASALSTFDRTQDDEERPDDVHPREEEFRDLDEAAEALPQRRVFRQQPAVKKPGMTLVGALDAAHDLSGPGSTVSFASQLRKSTSPFGPVTPLEGFDETMFLQSQVEMPIMSLFRPKPPAPHTVVKKLTAEEAKTVGMNFTTGVPMLFGQRSDKIRLAERYANLVKLPQKEEGNANAYAYAPPEPVAPPAGPTPVAPPAASLAPKKKKGLFGLLKAEIFGEKKSQKTTKVAEKAKDAAPQPRTIDGYPASMLASMRAKQQLRYAPPLEEAAERTQNLSSDSDDVCTCLNWADAYNDQYQAICGQALEFYFTRPKSNVTVLGKTHPILADLRTKLATDFCDRFFERNYRNYCLNMNYMLSEQVIGQWHSGTWCYVSEECTQLRGGSKVPDTHVSWKACQAGEDLILRETDPRTIFDLSTAQDFDQRMLPGYAYWYVDKDPQTMDYAWYKHLKSVGTPIFVWPQGETNFKNVERMVVSKDRVFRMAWNPEQEDGPKSARWVVTCEEGCDFINATAIAPPPDAPTLVVHAPADPDYQT